MHQYILDEDLGLLEIPAGFPGQLVTLPIPELSGLTAEVAAKLPAEARDAVIGAIVPWRADSPASHLAIGHIHESMDGKPIYVGPYPLESFVGACADTGRPVPDHTHLVAYTTPVPFVEMYRLAQQIIDLEERAARSGAHAADGVLQCYADARATQKELLEQLRLSLHLDWEPKVELSDIVANKLTTYRYVVDLAFNLEDGQKTYCAVELEIDGKAKLTGCVVAGVQSGVGGWASRRLLKKTQVSDKLAELQRIRLQIITAISEHEEKKGE